MAVGKKLDTWLEFVTDPFPGGGLGLVNPGPFEPSGGQKTFNYSVGWGWPSLIWPGDPLWPFVGRERNFRGRTKGGLLGDILWENAHIGLAGLTKPG